MLQTLLQNLIPIMESTVMFFVPLAMLMALAAKKTADSGMQKVWQGIRWGIIGALFIVVAKLGTKNAVSREVYESLVTVFALIGELGLIIFLWRGEAKTDRLGKPTQSMLFLVVLTLTLYHAFSLLLFPVSVVQASDTAFSLDVLLRMAGFLVGISLTVLTGLAVRKAGEALTFRSILIAISIQFAAIVLQQLIFLTQVMMARRFLPNTRGLMDIMAPLINHQHMFVFLMFAVIFILPLALILQRRPDKPAGANPAQYRQLLMGVRRQKRWGLAIVIGLLVMLSISTLGKSYAEKTEELVPAVTVTAVDGQIRIPLPEISDGHLHRFVYRASSGEMVRFIIIQKGGSAYGVGLDACEICGPTGYFERDGQVVCKLCDVVMNKATIGLKGGCNPIPIEYKVDEGSILVAQSGLEKERERFK